MQMSLVEPIYFTFRSVSLRSLKARETHLMLSYEIDERRLVSIQHKTHVPSTGCAQKAGYHPYISSVVVTISEA